MNFDLPPLDETTKPAFATEEECKRWLGDQRLANPASMQRQLCEQIELLNRRAIVARERFGILEALHSQVAFVQEAASKRYAAKPLPLLVPEAEAFAVTTALWQAVAVGYLRCLDDASGDAVAKLTQATLVERALSTLHAAQVDSVRGFAQPGHSHWSRIHQLLAFAERRSLTTMPVSDRVRYGEGAVTPLSVYVETILLHAASAHEFSARPLQWSVRWARRWSGKLVLRNELPADLSAVPINIDLASSLPPSPFPIRNAGQARFLDTYDLAASIKMRLSALAEGRSPAELQLGEDCSQPACEQLLRHLYQRWCKGGMQRPADRHAANEAIELVAGFETIWFQLSGSPFKQPRSSDELLRREREEIATFGNVRERRDVQMADMSKLRVISNWQSVNEGTAGLRLVRAVNAVNADNVRIGVGQLVAVKKTGSGTFVPASIRWLMLDEHGQLHAGVHLMPGVPTAVSIRSAGLNATQEKWRPAFVVLSADALPLEMVLPTGVFRPNRVIDVTGSAARQYKMMQLVERGEDFERVVVE